MKSKKPLITLFLIIFLNLYTNTALGQGNNTQLLYNSFDTIITKENLPINNGTLHINYDRTTNNENRYYHSDQYLKGMANYNNQNYYDLKFKYDIYKDVLILNLNQDSGKMGVNLTKEKIAFFIINGKKFINLSMNTKLPISFYSGFYEENFVGKTFTFYIKHRKEAKETTENKFVGINYILKKDFVLLYKNEFIKINSKRDLTVLFPDYKTKIDDFYHANRILESENETQFMENLMRNLNSFLTIESN